MARARSPIATTLALASIGLGVGLFGAAVAQATLLPPTEPEAPAPQHVRGLSVSPGTPVGLHISAIGVDARVQDVGVAKSGKLAVPSNYTDVGWYRYGPVPGQEGSAVFDGHVDNGLGFEAVFNNLHELAVGDEVVVRTAQGKNLRFVVREVASYRADEVPLERIFSQSGPPRLALITCAGEWSQSERSYSERVVVYAALAS